MKIGFYFGSFDPVHIGHINAIRCVLNSKVVDRVIVVPAVQNPWKKSACASFEDRLKMIKMAIMPFGEKCEVSEIERLNDLHYSYKTCQLLKEQCPSDDLFIIGGTDVAETISKWKNYDKVIKPNFGIISVNRVNNGTVKHVYRIDKNNIIIIDNAIEVSSTIIRDILSKGEIAYPLIPFNVENYIKGKKLYLNFSNPTSL